MKYLLTSVLFVASWTANGQDKMLFGKYHDAFFMYEFNLTLDSAFFLIQEDTDLGSRETLGTWTLSNDIIRLKPSKVWYARRPSQEKKEIPISINEILISVDSQK